MMFWTGLMLGLVIGFLLGAVVAIAGKKEILRRAQAVINQPQLVEPPPTQQLYPQNVSMSHSPGSCVQFLCDFSTGEIRGLNEWEGGDGAEGEMPGV